MFIGLGLGLVQQAIFGGVGDNALNDYGTPFFLADFIESEYRNNGPLSSSFTALTGLTFTRASTGYAQTQAGVLVPFASGAPRITDKGLLIEGARTNLCLRSQEFDNAAWTKTRSSVTADAAIAPDGTQTADKLIENTATANDHFVSQNFTGVDNTVYTGSVFVKAAERTWARVNLTTQAGGIRGAYINLSTGALGTISGATTATVTALADGWYRVSVAADIGAAGAGEALQVYIATADGTISYDGNGTSGIYIWGAQIE